MKYEVLFQLKGEQHPSHVAIVVHTRKDAETYCRKIENFPADTIHYAITCEDGRIIHDTRKEGLL